MEMQIKEVGENGAPDKDVFDIKTGVAIILAVKNKSNIKKLSKVFRFDMFGSREKKFEFLNANSLKSIKWNKISISEPNYEFVIRDYKIRNDYSKGFSVVEVFPVSSVGMVTARDGMSIQQNKVDIKKVVQDFQILDLEALRTKYNLGKEVRLESILS